MSGGEKGNDDEFDPIPVLISKNSNQGKADGILRRCAEAQTLSHKINDLASSLFTVARWCEIFEPTH